MGIYLSGPGRSRNNRVAVTPPGSFPAQCGHFPLFPYVPLPLRLPFLAQTRLAGPPRCTSHQVSTTTPSAFQEGGRHGHRPIHNSHDGSDTVSGHGWTGRRARESETESFIGMGMEVVGSVDSAGVVSVAGTVHGNVNAARQVLVARGGKVDGDVRANEVVLDGEITGSIVAKRVEVQSSAVIRGEITTPNLVIHEGAVMDVELVPQPRGPRLEVAMRPLDKRIALALTS